jgi:hypothetical protein
VVLADDGDVDVIFAADLAGVSMETVGKASTKAEIAFANASALTQMPTANFSA